jgi:D-inositol-3-phosphate glycosyltransferase
MSAGGGKPRLLLIGWLSPGSGVTRVLTNLAAAIADQYNIHVLALGAAPQAKLALPSIECSVWPFNTTAPQIEAGFPALLARLRPEIVLVLGPPPWAAPLLWATRRIRPQSRIVIFSGVEGSLANGEWLRPLAAVDDCILLTEHVRRDIVRHAAAAAPRRLPRLHVLPYGVDTAVFRPLAPAGAGSSEAWRAVLRRELFPGRAELADAFIVLNPNLLYRRKRLDLTIRGVALFARDKPPNVYLYLHQPRLDRHRRAQLEAAARSELGDRLLFNLLNPDGEVLPEESLNRLYNACDLGLTTAMGEGWGLTVFEHAATGAGQLVPDHSTFRENWAGAAEFVDAPGREHAFHEHADMHVVESAEVARKLEGVYADPARRRRLGELAYERATSARYLWSAVGDGLHEILQESGATAAVG